MAFNIEEFRSKAGSLQRTYQFKVVFPAVDGFGADDMKDVTLLVKSTKCPSKKIAAVDVPFAANQFKLPGNVTYDDWSCTFRVGTDIKVYNAMWEWSESVRNSLTNILSPPGTYKKVIELYQLDGSDAGGNAYTGEYILHGVWPNSIGEISLDTTTSEVQEFDVTFSYDYFNFKAL